MHFFGFFTGLLSCDCAANVMRTLAPMTMVILTNALLSSDIRALMILKMQGLFAGTEMSGEFHLRPIDFLPQFSQTGGSSVAECSLGCLHKPAYVVLCLSCPIKSRSTIIIPLRLCIVNKLVLIIALLISSCKNQKAGWSKHKRKDRKKFFTFCSQIILFLPWRKSRMQTHTHTSRVHVCFPN